MTTKADVLENKTQILTRGAILIALATVLALFAVFKLPNGGSVSIGSMVPIILFSLCYPVKWSLLTAVAFSGIQMLTGFYPPPTRDFFSFALVVVLEYIVAFGILGMAGSVCRRFKNKTVGIAFSGIFVCAIRFLCHFIAGILIWNVYAPEGQPVWLYSLVYNGSYMLPETVITVAILLFLAIPLQNPAFQRKLDISL